MQALTLEILQQHVQEHERLFQSLIELYTKGKWKITKQKKDLILYSMKCKGSSIVASRSEVTVEKPFQFVLKHFLIRKHLKIICRKT
jgi:hypothetical protein